jgi:hypothetical protein
MFSRGGRPQSKSSGVVWPDTGNGTPTTVKDVFGARPFSAHIATVGYDYDFHVGVDVDLESGETMYAPVGGSVIRLHRTHYGWESAAQLTYWTEDDDSSGAGATWARVAPSTLRITGTRGGAKTFPNVAKYKHSTERCFVTEVSSLDDWEVRVKLASTTAITGKFGFCLHNEDASQYVGMEWDGTNATAVGARSGGALTSHGTNRAVTTEPWLRVQYVAATDTISWDVSSDAVTWSNVASQTTQTFTDGTRPKWIPLLYWRSTDTNAATATVDVDYFGWFDGNGIGRFGNWFQIGRDGDKFCMMHFQDLNVNLGDTVQAGQVVGTAGLTGFDTRSGQVNAEHCHLEYHGNSNALYAKEDAVNPLDRDILPRTNVSNNVTVTRSTANDPDGVACWRLRIQVARGAQDFDLNSVTLTGDLATRTVNWNTRAGLNADVDIPKHDGVYCVPVDFTANSSEYEVSFYFSKAVVGTSFTSASVLDTDGATLWSE